MTIVVLVEEPSADIVLRALVSRCAPTSVVTVIPHEGKTDLRDSYPRKIRAWRHPPDVRFIVLMDNDSADCSRLKSELLGSFP